MKRAILTLAAFAVLATASQTAHANDDGMSTGTAVGLGLGLGLVASTPLFVTMLHSDKAKIERSRHPEDTRNRLHWPRACACRSGSNLMDSRRRRTQRLGFRRPDERRNGGRTLWRFLETPAKLLLSDNESVGHFVVRPGALGTFF